MTALNKEVSRPLLAGSADILCTESYLFRNLHSSLSLSCRHATALQKQTGHQVPPQMQLR